VYSTVVDGIYEEETKDPLSGVKFDAAYLGPLYTWIPVTLVLVFDVYGFP